MTDCIEFRVEGKPIGKARARVRRDGQTYTPKATKEAEERVRWAWRVGTRSSRVLGPVDAYVELVVARDDKHWLEDGTLDPQAPEWPQSKPDVDNVLKLVLDALNGLAYADDVSVVRAEAVRRFANAEEDEHVLVRLRPAPLSADQPQEAAA